MGPHRADILGKEGTVIELQNSSLSVDSIEEREAFYRRMIWVLNGEKFKDRIFIHKYREKKEFTFRWKNHKKIWTFAKKPVFIDFGSARLDAMLGAKRYKDPFYDPKAEPEDNPGSLLVRHSLEESDSPLTSLDLDPSLDPLPDFLMDSSIIQILKLYDTGFGVGRGITLEAFLAHYRG